MLITVYSKEVVVILQGQVLLGY